MYNILFYGFYLASVSCPFIHLPVYLFIYFSDAVAVWKQRWEVFFSYTEKNNMSSHLFMDFWGIVQVLYSLSTGPLANKAQLVCSVIKTNNAATVIDYSIINKDTKQLSVHNLF